jgi:hypothetical protein
VKLSSQAVVAAVTAAADIELMKHRGTAKSRRF